ncbi:hypothetical protein BC830DRAFT_1094125 [Chytriomyces sp. MP71]|nr:hypothetical protein BC830DRAFT_1094125 [Chytriomyces sp. MP71]
MTIRFYELIFDHADNDAEYFGGPNGWKTHLCLLHKGVAFDIQKVTHLELKNELTAKRNGIKATSPALGLEDGTILCDAFAIAEYLEQKYPSTPSLFTGSTSTHPDAVQTGKAYARFMDISFGSWVYFFELVVDKIEARVKGDAQNHQYFVSDERWGPGGFKRLMDGRNPVALLATAKENVHPLVKLLKERPFFQGEAPGFADYVVFGHYAMCRNNNAVLAKQVWEDQGEEIGRWVSAILARFPSIQRHLKPRPL